MSTAAIDVSQPAPAGGATHAKSAPARRWAPAVCLTLVSVIYFLSACLRASRDKLWFDEILTFDAASLLPSWTALWAFLRHGIEFNPPLSFVLAAASESIFGRTELALRLPSILAFWAMGACLYVFLRRRVAWPFALAGALLPAITAAGRYAHEARPYALVMAFAAAALLAWQSATEGRRRALALPAIALALAAALCSQPLAVVLALPFIAGETARSVGRRHIDWPIWCAFACSTPALLVLWAIKDAGNKAALTRFSGTLTRHVADTYAALLRPAIVPLAAALLLAWLLGQSSRAGRPLARGNRGVPGYELAALAGFALIPFAAVPASMLGGHYWIRYALACTIGIGGLAALLLARWCGRHRPASFAALLVLALGFLAGCFQPEGLQTDGGVPVVNTEQEIEPHLAGIPPGAPIVIGPPLTFVELEHYAPPSLAGRLYYLTDAAAAAAIDGNSEFEVKGPRLAALVPFRAHFADYHAFVAAHPRFYIVRPIRQLAREALAGRLHLEPRETSSHFQYDEAFSR